jgi:anti-sigma factor RsiW
MTCAETERTSVFLDGELDDAAAALAERHIATCADCRALVAASAEISEALRAPAARLTAPPLLKARILKRLDAEAAPSVRRPAFWWGALSGAGASALAASLLLAVTPPPAAETMASAVTDAHIHALTNGPRFQVASSSHHTVKPWFAGRAPLSPPVADYAPQGFTLIGGRVDKLAGRKAAVVVYRHGDHELDLFVWPTKVGALPASGDRLGYHEVFWSHRDLSFAAVSDMDATELARFVAMVRGDQRE